ncbi:MAG: Dyp-type peroxidase [Vicinamibacterales bacterium]
MTGAPRMEVLDRPDIQGLIIRAYRELPAARYSLLEIRNPGAFQMWLAERLRLGEITTSDQRPDRLRRAFNIAFTASGLDKLGVDPSPAATKHDGFGLEFREGLAHPDRSRFLGDVDASDPDLWVWGGRTGQRSHRHIDCVCFIFADHDHDRGGGHDTLAAASVRLRPEPDAAAIVHEIDAYLTPDNREHFGFRDGISQPTIRFTKRDYNIPADIRDLHVVEPGEFILGYENENRHMPVSPAVTRERDRRNQLGPLMRRAGFGRRRAAAGLRDFGRNGTYVVMRQLRQDVQGFRSFLESAAPNSRAAQERLAARMVGRWPNGTSLVLAPDREPQVGDEHLNDFRYFPLDRHGFRCPIGSHVRRSNQRDSTAAVDGDTQALRRVNSHRLLRRGRVYEPGFDPVRPEGSERGLVFICMNADLRRQFEFVQQSWLNGARFGGLLDERDPLVGPGGAFTVQRPEGNENVSGLRQFVTVRGGAYFFMPGIRALHCLADA